MSVIRHTVVKDSQGAQITLTTRSLSLQLLVETNSEADEQRVIEQYVVAQGYTAGSNYAYGNGSDNSVILKQIHIRRHPDPGSLKLWYVDLTYELPDSEDNTDENGDATSNPTEYYGQIETGFVVFDEPVRQAENLEAFPNRPANTLGPVTTSAGEIVVPPPNKTSHYLYLRLTKNCVSYSADLASQYMNTVNSDQARIFSRRIGFEMTIPKFCGKITNIGATWQQANGYSFWRVQTEILVNWREWRHKELDAGFYAKAEAGDADGQGGSVLAGDVVNGKWNVRRVKECFGQDTSKPVLLDGRGLVKIKAGGKLDPTYLPYRIYYEYQWAGLLASVFPP